MTDLCPLCKRRKLGREFYIVRFVSNRSKIYDFRICKECWKEELREWKKEVFGEG